MTTSIGFFLVSAASAGYEKRQTIQTQKIEMGVNNGTISSSEAERLKKGQVNVEKRVDRLEATKADIKSDGVVTKDEKQQLIKQRASVRRTQARQVENIQRKKQNNR